ncbi:MAG: hypothetical protein ACK5QX_10060 [bacterium]|jgi:hypothetical protein
MHYTKFISGLRKLKNDMPILVGNECVNFALDNIRASQDAFGRPFKVRSPKAKRNKGRKLLIDRGDGRRSIRILRATAAVIEITANDYMEAHNTGVNKTVTISGHTRTKSTRVSEGTGVFSVRSKRERTRTRRVASGSYSVKTHSRKMNLPQRTFLAPGPRLKARITRLLINRFKSIL